jgi:tetratricopeptide (TPR) repeat protein
MAKKPQSAATTLDEIESLGDRLAVWVENHSAAVLGTALAVLVLAGAYGFYTSSRSGGSEEASAALAQTQADFRKAMGSPADALDIEEPANPETARRARARFVDRFLAVAQDHAGTPIAALARLEAGQLQEELGEVDQAVETWRTAAQDARAGAARALLLERIGGALEEQGEFEEAAAAYEDAFGIADYPLRYEALADAARCHAEAGNADRAIELFDRIESEAPDVTLAPHLASLLRETRAAQLAN